MVPCACWIAIAEEPSAFFFTHHTHTTRDAAICCLRRSEYGAVGRARGRPGACTLYAPGGARARAPRTLTPLSTPVPYQITHSSYSGSRHHTHMSHRQHLYSTQHQACTHRGATHHHLPLKFLLTAFKSAGLISSRPSFLATSSACLHRASSMGSSASSSATTAP